MFKRLKNTGNGSGMLGLNDTVIDKLQNYYRITIRRNVGSLAAIKTAIYAAFNKSIAQMAQTAGDCWKTIKQTLLPSVHGNIFPMQ